MLLYRLIILLIFLFVSFQVLHCQDKQSDIDYFESLVNLPEENREGLQSEINERIEDLVENPIDINLADEDELLRIPYLTPFQANSIIQYREKNYGFRALYELQSLFGFDLELAEKVFPFFRIGKIDYLDTVSFKSFLKNSRNKLIFLSAFDIEEKAGYSEKYDTSRTGFLGDPIKTLIKYRSKVQDKILAGFTLEKDPGEKWASQSSPDYMSGYIVLKDYRFLKILCVGDYSVGFGEGLVAWNTYSMGKSTIVTNTMKPGSGINPYSSTDENRMLRGIAATVSHQSIRFSVFFSYKSIDATLGKDSLTFSSFSTSGLHSTIAEMNKKNQVDEMTTGLSCGIRKRNWETHINSSITNFNIPYSRSEEPYHYFDFRGYNSQALSLSGKYRFRRVVFSFEQAISQNDGFASTNHLQAEIFPNLSLSLNYRYFNTRYYSRYNAAFSENSLPSNETGLYSGAEYQPFSKLKIKAYSDIFQFYWLKYQVDGPSYGSDYFIQVESPLNRKLLVYFRFKNKYKIENYNIEETYNQRILSGSEVLRYRLGANYSPFEGTNLKSVVEWSESKINQNIYNGFFLGQTIGSHFINNSLKAELYLGIFDTEHFNSSIYNYENNVSQSFSFPALNGQGVRSYMLMKWKIVRKMEIGARYSITSYNDRDYISDGLNRIEGSIQSEIVFQFTSQF